MWKYSNEVIRFKYLEFKFLTIEIKMWGRERVDCISFSHVN